MDKPNLIIIHAIHAKLIGSAKIAEVFATKTMILKFIYKIMWLLGHAVIVHQRISASIHY